MTDYKLKIGQQLWHPMSIDIIEYRVSSIIEYEDRVVYVARATGNVGACGRIEVELAIDKYIGNIIFIGMAGEYEHGKGLKDFVEGLYFVTKKAARIEYYKLQRTLAWTNMENKRRIYDEAKVAYDRCVRILRELNMEEEE